MFNSEFLFLTNYENLSSHHNVVDDMKKVEGNLYQENIHQICVDRNMIEILENLECMMKYTLERVY